MLTQRSKSPTMIPAGEASLSGELSDFNWEVAPLNPVGGGSRKLNKCVTFALASESSKNSPTYVELRSYLYFCLKGDKSIDGQ